jgi:EF hand domain-containing protein
MNTNELMQNLKPFTLALVLAFGVGTMTAVAEDTAQPENTGTVDARDNTPYVAPIESTANTDWMSPTAAEFVKLDKTGNGLLLPYEASKDKAFNKKTFSKADIDKDGYIDLNEYTQFKTGKLPDEQASSTGAIQGQ